MCQIRNLIVIGGGAAAYSAALYAARANLHPLVIEGSLWGWGGQLIRAVKIENYPGLPEGVQGPALVGSLRAQAELYGAEFVSEDVTAVEVRERDGLKRVLVGDTLYEARELIIATGAHARTLGLESERRLTGHGVSYHTTCETHKRHAVVVGGGDSACTDALTLALFVSKVTIVHRSGNFRASAIMLDRVRANPKIEILTDRVVREVEGDTWVSGVVVEHLPSGARETIACDGLFVAIGNIPNSVLFQGQLPLNRDGYLHTEPGSTRVLDNPGIYAAGGVADNLYRQAVTAAASGCMAAMDATRSFAYAGHAPQPVSAATPVVKQPGRIVVLIPAHNEEALIGEALSSLDAQTRLPDEVIVVADRCTDGTCAVTTAHGATVRTTIDNRDKKAGGLNQMLSHLLPRLSDEDAVFVMDADSTIVPEFLEVAERKLREPANGQAELGGVGGIFLGSHVHSLLHHIQNNEYLRYAGEIGRRKGRADVLTGTATLFSAKALRHVLAARRAGALPQGGGNVYDVKAQTEDNELTLALKHLGYRCVSPKECVVATEIMPSWKRLYLQRLRWQRGALENLHTYGITRQTAPYLAKQFLTYLGVAFVPFFLATLAYTAVTTGAVPWSWFWLGVTSIVAFERIWSVRKGGRKALVLAVSLVPEILYDQFLHGVYVKSFTDMATDARERWDHTTPDELAHARPWRRWWNRLLTAVFAGAPLTGTVAAAIGCATVGIAWPTIGAFVLLGAGQATLRLIGLDLFRHLGSGELDRAPQHRPQAALVAQPSTTSAA